MPPFPGLPKTDSPGYVGSEAAGVSEVPQTTVRSPSPKPQREAQPQRRPQPQQQPEWRPSKPPVEEPAPAEVEYLQDQPTQEAAEAGEPNHTTVVVDLAKEDVEYFLVCTP